MYLDCDTILNIFAQYTKNYLEIHKRNVLNLKSETFKSLTDS